MDTEILERLGITKNQALIYLSLLRLGSAHAQDIIRESGLHSSRVYDSLEKLEGLGLVSHVTKDFKKYFQAVEPEKLLDYIDEQKEALKQALPQLKSLEGMKKEEIHASVYKGKEGIKSILSTILREGQDIYILGAKGIIFSELKYFMPNFERERIKKKIRFIKLYDNSDRATISKNQLLSVGKILPPGSDSDAVVWIFGNKTAIIVWKEKYPSAFLIEKKEVAEAFRKWFQLMYARL